jgi:hypothetical protein
MKEEIPLTTKSTSAGQRMERDSPPYEKKEWNTIHKIEKYIHHHTIKYFQINLKHSKAATAALCRQLAEGKIDVALIHEPWLYNTRAE